MYITGQSADLLLWLICIFYCKLTDLCDAKNGIYTGTIFRRLPFITLDVDCQDKSTFTNFILYTTIKNHPTALHKIGITKSIVLMFATGCIPWRSYKIGCCDRKIINLCIKWLSKIVMWHTVELWDSRTLVWQA